jgi:septation ring formation regulator EzrA
MRNLFSSFARTVGRAGLVAALGFIAVGCQLQSRDGGESTEPSKRDNTGPILAEAQSVHSQLESLVSSGQQTRDKAADATNSFIAVEEGVEAKQLNLKAVREVLQLCWSRPATEATCEVPAKLSAAANRLKKDASQPTKDFLANKLDAIEQLRSLLREDVPGSADRLSSGASDAQSRLSDLRSRLEAEATNPSADAAALDQATQEMQVLESKIQARIDEAQQLASELKQSAENYGLTVDSTITDVFQLGAKKKTKKGR